MFSPPFQIKSHRFIAPVAKRHNKATGKLFKPVAANIQYTRDMNRLADRSPGRSNSI